MKKLFSILAAVLFAGSMMAADATMAAGTNAQVATVNTKAAVKVGTSKADGDMTVTVAAAATKLTVYAAAWNNAAGKIAVEAPTGVTLSVDSLNLTADAGISGSSTNYTIADETLYKFEITLTGVAAQTAITLKSGTARRFVVWGAQDDTAAPEPQPQPAVLSAVSDSTTWDFAKLTANTESSLYGNNGIQLTDASTPSKKDEIVYSEYKNNLWTVDAAFNDSALAFKGEYPIRKNQYCQNGVLRFNAGVAGNIIVKFSDTGTSASTTAVKRYLVVNGDTTQYWSSRENNGTENPYDAQLNVVTEAIPVPAGDVTITGTAALVIYYVTFVPQVLPTPTNCVEAAAAALSVSANNELYNNGAEYTIEGYVTKIQTAYSDQYHNITFWMADAADGGEVLEAFRAACASEADAPAVGAKVAVTGKLTKYNTTPEFAAGCTFVITAPAPTPNAYYVVGSMTNWGPNADYKLAANPVVEGEYMGAFTFAANDEFKVAYSDGNTIDDANWFPTGMGNNYQITEAGEYTVYFRPAGNTEWANGYFTAVKKEVPVIEAITVAEAIQLGMALDSMGVSDAEYTVEGYVINALPFSVAYMNQSWYMADAADAAASDFEAYNCYPIENGDTLKVLNGDKVFITGKLKKYYSKSAAKYIIEIEKANATFISKVEGDHSIDKGVEVATVARALEIGAALGNNAVSEKQYKIRGYVSAVDVKASDAYSEQHKNQSFWVADAEGSTAATNADGAFYVYRGKPDTEKAIPYGALVEFTCTIKKYVPAQGGDPVIENADQNIVVTVISEPEPVEPELPEGIISCDSALILAAGITDPTEANQTVTSNAIVTIRGYAVTVFTPKNDTQSAWLNDDKNAKSGVIQAYSLAITEEIAKGDYVDIQGNLAKFMKSDGATIVIEVVNGTMKKVAAEGIENIVLTEKAQKVMVDGVIYIVRDNKMYNVQGIQVR